MTELRVHFSRAAQRQPAGDGPQSSGLVGKLLLRLQICPSSGAGRARGRERAHPPAKSLPLGRCNGAAPNRWRRPIRAELANTAGAANQALWLRHVQGQVQINQTAASSSAPSQDECLARPQAHSPNGGPGRSQRQRPRTICQVGPGLSEHFDPAPRVARHDPVQWLVRFAPLCPHIGRRRGRPAAVASM